MDKPVVSQLSFKDYIVLKMIYEINRDFDFESEKLNVGFDIFAEVQITENDDSEAVTLKVKCGDLSKKDCPFHIEVEVLGIFEFQGNPDEIEMFLTTSAVSILFPYVRSIVSDLSMRSNQFPTYKLPLINVVKTLKETNSITIKRI